MLSNLGDIEWFVSSITQISPIALEASSSNEIEGKIDEDDKYEAQVEREKDEVEHDEIKENILRQSQQVVHPGQSLKIFLLSDGGEGGGWKTKLCFNYQKVPTATADFSSRPAMILLHCSTAPLQHQSSGRQNWPFAAEPQPDRQTGLDWSWGGPSQGYSTGHVLSQSPPPPPAAAAVLQDQARFTALFCPFHLNFYTFSVSQSQLVSIVINK